eukprot:12447530-Prorocentrum_lima.AAC.1
MAIPAPALLSYPASGASSAWAVRRPSVSATTGSDTACAGCVAGTYSDYENAPTCSVCPPGSFCPENATAPVPCVSAA